MPGDIYYDSIANHLSGEGCPGRAGNHSDFMISGKLQDFTQILLASRQCHSQRHFLIGRRIGCINTPHQYGMVQLPFQLLI